MDHTQLLFSHFLLYTLLRFKAPCCQVVQQPVPMISNKWAIMWDAVPRSEKIKNKGLLKVGDIGRSAVQRDAAPPRCALKAEFENV